MWAWYGIGLIPGEVALLNTYWYDWAPKTQRESLRPLPVYYTCTLCVSWGCGAVEPREEAKTLHFISCCARLKQHVLPHGASTFQGPWTCAESACVGEERSHLKKQSGIKMNHLLVVLRSLRVHNNPMFTLQPCRLCANERKSGWPGGTDNACMLKCVWEVVEGICDHCESPSELMQMSLRETEGKLETKRGRGAIKECPKQQYWGQSFSSI